jgi:ubiquitin C-terminal hydrolase
MDIYSFINNGNDCYFIVAIHAIIDMLYVKQTISDKEHLQNHFINILNSSIIEQKEGFNIHQLLNPNEIKRYLASKNHFFNTSEQQDASECFIHILDQFTKENTTKPERFRHHHHHHSEKIISLSVKHLREHDKLHGYSPISDLYLGQFISKKICTNCGDTTHAFETFTNIDVIPCGTSLSSCMTKYLEEERVELKCDRCYNPYVDKKTHIIKYPNILVFTIKRFDETTFNSSMIVNPNIVITNETKILNYRLRLIIHHIGRSMHGGHYYATMHTPNVTIAVNDNQIFKTNDDFSKTVYMVFYELGV